MRRLRQWSGHAWLAVPMRWYLGGLFLFACVHKIADPGAFALDIATYDVMPLAAINLMAIILPWVELAAAVLLLVGIRCRPAALLVAGMMVVFIVALMIALARGLDMSCGCFASQGATEDPISWVTVVRDLGWLAMALYVLSFDRHLLGLGSLWRAKPTGMEA